MPPSQAPSLRRHALLSVALAGALAACAPAAGPGDAGDAIATRDAAPEDDRERLLRVRGHEHPGACPLDGATLVEATAGNTGMGLAIVAAVRGAPLEFGS